MKKTAQNLMNEKLAEALQGLAEAYKFNSESRDIIMRLLQFEGGRIDTLENKINLLMTERDEAIVNRNPELFKFTEEEDERMKNIVRNGNDGEHYADDTEYLTSSKANKERLDKAIKEVEHSIAKKVGDDLQDFWEGRLGEEYDTVQREANEARDKYYKGFGIPEPDKPCDEHLDRIAETEITPKALLKLGFEEVYQEVDMGEPGFIYYSLDVNDIGFCSSEQGENLFVVMDHNNLEIRNLRKLGDLILSLRELETKKD